MSSSTYANNTNNAWNVNFNNGNDNNNNKSNSYYVRAVRGGKSSLLSCESVYTAYLDCRKRKRGTMNALRFEYNLLENLFSLASELQKGTYQPSRSVCFITRNPKLREVFAADFRDRIVHHLLVRELEKYWESRFIYDSYASRPGKGIHSAVKRLQGFMLRASKNRKRAAYFIKLDIRSFFMSIDKNILFSIFEKHTESDVLLYLLSIIIFHDCTKNYYFKGDPSVLEKVPPHKSLFKVGHDKGLPIGNLTSQFFANVYLNELDQFVKHKLRCCFYLRYVDDFILISHDPAQLLEWHKQIEAFLAQTLALELKSESDVIRVSEGADFLGYIVKPSYMLSRQRVVNNLKYKLSIFKEKFVTEFQINGRYFQKISTSPEMVTELRQVLASYLGHFKHAATFHLIRSLFEKNTWLQKIFAFQDGSLTEKLELPRMYRFMKSQVNFIKSRFEKNHVFFIRIGRYIELYDDDALLMNSLLKLKLRSVTRGMHQAVGFLPHKLPIFDRKILDAGYNTVFIEEGEMGKYIKQRYVKEIHCLNHVV